MHAVRTNPLLKLLALVLLALWLIATVMGAPLFFGGGVVLSIDEEWSGWGNWLLNPYIVAPYAVERSHRSLLGGVKIDSRCQQRQWRETRRTRQSRRVEQKRD